MAESSETCPLCGGPSRPAASVHGRDYCHCGTCFLLFIPREQMPLEAECRERYSRHLNSPGDAGYVAFLESAVRAVERLLPPGGRVLDLGCGPEPVLAGLLEARGYDVFAHDLLFRPSDLSGRAFACVVATEVFEHFQEPAAAVARAVALLQPGGFLVVLTLLLGESTDLSTWWYLRDRTHVVFYAEQTFDWIARRHDLERVECDGKRLVVLRRRAAGGAGQ